MSKPANKMVAAKPSNDMELYQSKPSHLSGTARGSENVQMSDLVVPRLELVQPLSPCKDDSDAAYIDGAKDGLIFNTVTRQVYGDALTIVPVWFRKQQLIFRKRTAGGGFRGSFDTVQDAEVARKARLAEGDTDLEIIEAGEHFVLVVGESVEQAMLTCTKTKLKMSRQLNSFVQLRGEDRFASAYELSSVKEKNDKGTYYNFKVRPLGFVSERIYNEGLKLWKAVSSGERNVRADMSDLDSEVAASEEM